MNLAKIHDALRLVEQMLDYGDAPCGLVHVRDLLEDLYIGTPADNTPRRPGTAGGGVTQTWPLWAAFVLFVAAAACVPTLMHFRQTRQPKDLVELAERIRSKHPDWHIVPENKTGTLEGGFRICATEKTPLALARLRRMRGWEDKWQGVVLCSLKENVDNADPGEYGLTIHEFSLYGDPAMMAEIVELLR